MILLGNIPITKNIQELLSLTDLVLLDIKHIDTNKSKELVGAYNNLELEFAKYLSNNNIPMWIRQVLIPTITDDKNDLENLKKFINTLNGVNKVELLPYHSVGKYKWDNLNLDYSLKDIPDCDDIILEKAKKILGI